MIYCNNFNENSVRGLNFPTTPSSSKLIQNNSVLCESNKLKENNSYKYLVIGFNNKEAASKVKEEMRKKGFDEAFVVGYRDGARVE